MYDLLIMDETEYNADLPCLKYSCHTADLIVLEGQSYRFPWMELLVWMMLHCKKISSVGFNSWEKSPSYSYYHGQWLFWDLLFYLRSLIIWYWHQRKDSSLNSVTSHWVHWHQVSSTFLNLFETLSRCQVQI